jgi:hypothetical protein
MRKAVMIRCLTVVVATRPRVPMFVVLFGATLFLSAFLLFAVQPLIARMLLPLLGGAAGVWTTCLVFFQTALLGGYAYAHGSTTVLGVRKQIWPHVLVVLLPLAVLPIHVRTDGPASTESPVAWLLLALLISMGLPFFALSTSAAVLQKWYSVTDDERASDPYFLYAASNLGSLTALLAYPTLIEPTLRLDEQGRWWTCGYVAFAVLVTTCAVAVWRQPSAHAAHRSGAETEQVTWRRRARWMALAFIPSSLLLGVTTHISTDIASMPLLWIVPLSLYLVTFILAFRSTTGAVRAVSARLMPILVVPLALFVVAQFNQPMAVVIPFHLLTFLVIAVVCHGELADDRPSRTHLTELYLWMSVGGTLGGLFNALVAPAIFDRIVEYPLVLALSCLVIPASLRAVTSRSRVLSDVVFPFLVGALAISAVLVNNRLGADVRWLMIGFLVPALLAFSQRRHPLRFAACVAAILVSGMFVRERFGHPLLTERTFFGVYRVTEDARSHLRMIVHGTTIHGMQSTLPEQRREPLSYYHRTGPIGQVFASVPAASMSGDIAIAGLGAGSLASYRGPSQRVTFYELDPIVERLARDPSFFTYLSDCGSHCVVLTGDARLSLARATPGQFRIIVLDTFSSDAIPVHLLTREALSLYLSKLAPGGVIAVHVSNMHVAVDRVTARLAQDAGLTALSQSEPPDAGSMMLGKLPSDWMVLARRREDLGPLADDPRWIVPAASPVAPLWTDDFSNIVGVLK